MLLFALRREGLDKMPVRAPPLHAIHPEPEYSPCVGLDVPLSHN